MKKHALAALLVVIVCLVTALSACTVLEKLEKDVQVSLKVGEETWGPYTVNTFNNAIVPEPEAPAGKMFYGWTNDADWQSKNLSEVRISQNKGLLRFDDVKDILNGSTAITLYPVFGDIPRHDIAIAWYDKENTSGLNQTVMDSFTAALRAYLVSAGKNPDEMDIVIRGYQGNVGTTCTNIKADGDIDIMVGWSSASNLEGTGGLKPGTDFLQNYGNITLTGGAKARYAARLGDSELCKDVYAWILSTYGGAGATKDYDVADAPVDPDPEPVPDPSEPLVITDNKLVVSIWNNTSGAWITANQIDLLKTDFQTYLTGRGVDVSTLDITWRVETEVSSVSNLVAAVNAAGDVDFVLACGNNVNSSGNLTNLEKLQIAETPYMTAGRFIAVLNKDNPRQLAKVLYEFISNQKYPEPEAPVDPDPTPNPDPTPVHDLVIAWYDKESTSGLNQTIIDSFTSALREYLVSQSKNPDEMDIVIRGYQGNVGDSCAAIKADGDVDIMIGWSTASNLEGTGGMTKGTDFLQNYGNITLTGAPKARYAARLSDSELCKDVYAWILSTYGGAGATKDYDVNDLVITDTKLVVSIWNNTSGAWITANQIDLLKTDFEAYLTGRGVDVSTLDITWRVETEVSSVSNLVAAVNAAGDVDFVLACGKNVNSSGNLTDLVKTEIAETPYMTDGRYIAVLHKDAPRQLAVLLYEFMSGSTFSA